MHDIVNSKNKEAKNIKISVYILNKLGLDSTLLTHWTQTMDRILSHKEWPSVSKEDALNIYKEEILMLTGSPTL